MFQKSIHGFGLIGLLVGTTVGCAAASSADEQSSQAALSVGQAIGNPADEGSFQLYATPRATRDAHCDAFTALDLTHVGMQAGLIAELHEVVNGNCSIALLADPRTYRLILEKTECGSNVYRGSAAVDGTSRQITVTDHRSRYCRDFVPAEIVVEEGPLTGDKRALYSLDTP
jgi:hypothetical protein